MTHILPQWTNAIHHDGSEIFVSNPLAKVGESVDFRLRTPITTQIIGVYMRAMINGEFSYQLMEQISQNAVSQMWQCTYDIQQKHIPYVFMLMTDAGAIYYNARGLSLSDSPDNNAFRLIADYDAPLWVRDEVYYQIFPERFANGDESNDVQDGELSQKGYPSVKRKWGELPYPWKKAGSMDFFGGDVNGITQKLDYLQELGITGIYTTPIFEATSNHKYDITNFFHVDKHFGGDDALAELREESSKRDMTLMLDITPNHCSYKHPWVTNFKEHIDGDTSEFFYYDTEKDEFETWLGVPSLIKLNYSSQRLRDVMYRNQNSAIRKWLEPPYSIDAWRLDVANMTGNQGTDQLDHEVWCELRKYARQSNPDTYLLGEYFQDGTPHLQGEELDASMNYQGFNVPMRRWLVPENKQVIKTDNPYLYKPSIPAEVMAEQWQIFMGAIPYPIALQQFNQLDSHDVTRILHETFGDKALVKLGTALMMGFPGVPCIYYGTEIGMTGAGDPDNRRCMPWDESQWDKDMLAYFQKIIAIRKESDALKNGGFQILLAEGDVVAFARASQSQTMLVAGYRGNDTLENIVIDVAQADCVDDTMFTDLLSNRTYTVSNGQLTIDTIEHGQTLFLAQN